MEKFVIIKDEKLTAPIFKSVGGKVIGFFQLPLRYNPLLFLAAFLKEKRISQDTIAESFRITNVLLFREASFPCKCGKESGLISLITAEKKSVGKQCLLNGLINKS